jgi:hypothetical protein
MRRIQQFRNVATPFVSALTAAWLATSPAVAQSVGTVSDGRSNSSATAQGVAAERTDARESTGTNAPIDAERTDDSEATHENAPIDAERTEYPDETDTDQPVPAEDGDESISTEIPRGIGPEAAEITRVVHGGNGCPSSSTLEVKLSDDGKLLAVYPQESVLTIGPKTRPNVGASCNVSVTLDAEPGWQYAVVGLNRRGTLWLYNNVTAKLKWHAFFQGQRSRVVEQTLTGPMLTGRFEQTVLADHHAVQWSSCDDSPKTLILRQRLTLNNQRNREGQGYAKFGAPPVDTRDSNTATSVYALAWRECSTDNDMVR